MVVKGEIIFIRQWRNPGPANYFRARVASNPKHSRSVITVEYDVIDHDPSGAKPVGMAYWNDEESPPCWDDGSY